MGIIVSAEGRGFKVTYRDPGKGRANLPLAVKRRILQALRQGTLGIGMDYDNTMVRTDEGKRIFTRLDEDSARVIDPMVALIMLGVPQGIFTGNTVPYIRSLGVGPFHGRLAHHGILSAMTLFDVYAQNATQRLSFDATGEEVKNAGQEYKKQYLFPAEDMLELERVYAEVIGEVVQPFPHRPLITREPGIQSKAYYPISQNRGGVQFSWIGVPAELREQIIALATARLGQRFLDRYTHQAAGDYSIDVDSKLAAKYKGTEDFRERRGLNVLVYLGDSVTVKERDGTGQPTIYGNDYPVVWDKNAFVLAVNPHQESVPQHDRIIPAGPGPESTAAWLKWLLIEKAQHILRQRDLSPAATQQAIQALSIGGLI